MSNEVAEVQTPFMRQLGSDARLLAKRRTQFMAGWESVDKEIVELIDAAFEVDKATHKAKIKAELEARLK
jgi:hypothetical protein